MATSHLEAAVQQQAIDALQALLVEAGASRAWRMWTCGRLSRARQGRGAPRGLTCSATPATLWRKLAAAAGPGQPVRIGRFPSTAWRARPSTSAVELATAIVDALSGVGEGDDGVAGRPGR